MHVYVVARSLAMDFGQEVTLVMADRGWAGHEALGREPFRTLLLPPDSYYDRSEMAQVVQHTRAG